MAAAIPSNIEHLTSMIEQIVPAGETYYTNALQIAFALLQNAFNEDRKQTRNETYESLLLLQWFIFALGSK